MQLLKHHHGVKQRHTYHVSQKGNIVGYCRRQVTVFGSVGARITVVAMRNASGGFTAEPGASTERLQAAADFLGVTIHKPASQKHPAKVFAPAT